MSISGALSFPTILIVQVLESITLQMYIFVHVRATLNVLYRQQMLRGWKMRKYSLRYKKEGGGGVWLKLEY